MHYHNKNNNKSTHCKKKYIYIYSQFQIGIKLSNISQIVIIPWWAEPRRHTVVVLFVCLDVCACLEANLENR